MAEFYDSVEITADQAEENRVVRKSLTAYPEPFLSGMKLEGGIELWNPSTETGLTLNTIDSNNVVWVVTDIDGWWNLPESEVPDLPRGWGDGSYDAVGRWANRIISLNGAFLPQEPEDAAAARNTLMDYLSPMVKTTTAGYIIVSENGSPFSVNSITYSNTTATITNAVGNGTNVVYTTSGSHGFSTNDIVTVNGSNPESLNVPLFTPIVSVTNNTFTIASDVVDSYVANAVATSHFLTYATVTSHDLEVGDRLVVSEVSPKQFNLRGNETSSNLISSVITSVTSNTITVPGALNATYLSGGTVRKKLRKAAKVRLSGVPGVVSINPRGRHDFFVGLKAVDPIKYEFVDGDPDGYVTATINTGSSWEVTVVNKGNTAVPIIIEISGVTSIADPNNPPQITNDANSQTISLVGGVTSGHKLEIDTYNREALDVTYVGGVATTVVNGRSKLPVIVDWIYLEPGSNRLYVDNPPAGSEWVIYYRSGWIS